MPENIPLSISREIFANQIELQIILGGGGAPFNTADVVGL
jgi:hypothetical protein